MPAMLGSECFPAPSAKDVAAIAALTAKTARYARPSLPVTGRVSILAGVSELRPFSPPPTPRRRHRVASRMGTAEAATIATIVLTAIALIVYFAWNP